MKIQNKLFLILFGFSLLLVTILVFLMQWSIGKGMVDYVNTKEIQALKPVVVKLAAQYKRENSWQGLLGEHDKFRRLISAQLFSSEFPSLRQSPPPERRPFREPKPQNATQTQPPPPDRQDFKGRMPPPNNEGQAHHALLDADGNIVAGIYLNHLKYSKTAIMVNNTVVGFLAVSKRNHLTQGYELDFIEQQHEYLWIIALITMTLVALLTLPLARHVVEPIKLIIHGMHRLTLGDYQQPIDLKRQDELGQLSRDYNELAQTLNANDTARKRWLANISHELRTPVAILRGELEAMLDQVRPITRNNIASANDEVKHLQRLIDDLNLLTSADIGGMHFRKQHEELTGLIQCELEKYRSYLADAGIALNFVHSEQEIIIYGDKTRLCQLFENIINNCVKYSSASQLNISLNLENFNDASTAIIKFEDNGNGVDDIHLMHLFEHLYRVEDSRNRKTGGSGLGLSICRHIVQGHQGEIIAEQSSLGGLAIIIKLPIE